MTREEAIELLVNATYSDEWQGNEQLTEANLMAIEALQTEVVRCKDCIHWSDEFHWCNIRDSYGWDYKPDDYCSYGERIEE